MFSNQLRKHLSPVIIFYVRCNSLEAQWQQIENLHQYSDTKNKYYMNFKNIYIYIY